MVMSIEDTPEHPYDGLIDPDVFAGAIESMPGQERRKYDQVTTDGNEVVVTFPLGDQERDVRMRNLYVLRDGDNPTEFKVLDDSIEDESLETEEIETETGRKKVAIIGTVAGFVVLGAIAGARLVLKKKSGK
jgi:hypothetical protein